MQQLTKCRVCGALPTLPGTAVRLLAWPEPLFPGDRPEPCELCDYCRGAVADEDSLTEGDGDARLL